MKKILTTLLVFISINTFADVAFESCKSAILESKPYGKNAEIKQPTVTSLKFETTFDWGGTDDLIITTKEGDSSPAAARCIYDSQKEKITFLIIYADTLISKYPKEVAALKNADTKSAYDISKKLGLSKEEIDWLKSNGARNVFSTYNQFHKKEVLVELNKKNLILYFHDKNHPNQFMTGRTDLSALLAKLL